MEHKVLFSLTHWLCYYRCKTECFALDSLKKPLILFRMISDPCVICKQCELVTIRSSENWILPCLLLEMLCSISIDKLTFIAALKTFIPSSLMLLKDRRRDSPILSSDYKVILTSSCYQKRLRYTGRHFDLPHSASNDTHAHTHSPFSCLPQNLCRYQNK
jgi:hypothetical protein